MKKFQYNFSGLEILSDINLQLINESSVKAKPDLEIKYDPSIKISNKKNFKCNLNKIILNYPQIGAINIERSGELLTFNYKVLNLNFLSKILNHGIGYSYYQKKKLALHGSAVEFDKYATIFMGESGSGKSSLLAALSTNFQPLSDDTIGLEVFDAEVSMHPGLSYFKIESAIANELGIQNKAIELNDDRNRVLYQSNNKKQFSLPVRSCYILRWGKEDIIQEIDSSKDKIAAFLQSAYTCFPMNSCVDSASILMNLSSAFFKNVKMYYFIRKKGNIMGNTKIISEHITAN